MSCKDLDVINTIIKIEGKLINLTPLRVGQGKAQEFTEATDNPIMKIKGKPVIPGSSLKGVFRSMVEAYIKSLNDQKYRVCDISDDECTSCDKNSYCIPCIIFGFKDLASRVYILDSIAEEFSIGQRTMVAINRVFGGNLPGNLYTLDFVEPNSRFDFSMIIYNLDLVNQEKEDWKKVSVNALKYVLKTLVTDGIFVGGKKSAGYGLVKLTGGKLKYYKSPNLLTPKEYDLNQVL
ncbi:CRISPR-associated RAMP protein [Sulfolobus sp. A20]|uniref:type III CRISPR-associated RAMP protein Csx7 n=1 Tax=Saccharolobus sp. A20 TaxID=1891280 RepID=UPI0008460446|nr:CRISPR-associated RAMP protein Csx7 [Sulfolobus sp. A20]AOL15396.1 CRISPR-associated RAMP protein [Sulfolobus sp. A20]TRM77709.1 CRISPR-associated RAMP protein [Sulfolobus sp. A20-N-F8]TRN00978.1 CRISPR-associated RAMP protein [Sulfolobus sp. F1]TRN03375.1 CRISPR-associated RAMP protein [Sulfolobus sp. E1]